MIILHRKFPPGGVVGQFLRKCSSKDNDVEWANIPSGSSLPDGGTTGQALRKASNADQDVSWQNDPDPFPSGGSTGQVLTKTASGRAWQNVPNELPTGNKKGRVLVTGATNYVPEWSTKPLIYTIETDVVVPNSTAQDIANCNVYADGVLIGTVSQCIYDIKSDVIYGYSILKMGVIPNTDMGTLGRMYLLSNAIYNGQGEAFLFTSYIGSKRYISYVGLNFEINLYTNKLKVTSF